MWPKRKMTLVDPLGVRAVPRVNALWPPREQCRGPDESMAAAQLDHPLGLNVLSVLDRGEMPIDQRSVGQWPEMLDRLQLRRVGRKEQKMDMLRHAQPGAHMPPGPVQHQNNFLVGTGLHFSGKRFEFRFEESNAHTGGEMADGTA